MHLPQQLPCPCAWVCRCTCTGHCLCHQVVELKQSNRVLGGQLAEARVQETQAQQQVFHTAYTWQGGLQRSCTCAFAFFIPLALVLSEGVWEGFPRGELQSSAQGQTQAC